MRHLRWAVPAALVLALSTPFPAAADDRHGGGAIVAPSGGGELALWFKTFIELPTPVNPRYGDGEDPCVRLGPRGKILVAITFGQVVTCTAELGTVVNTGGGHFCSTFDPPDSPFYAVGPREQRRCARAVSNHETGMRVSVDGGPWVDLFQPQFTAYTPPTIVRLPVDNAFGVPPQTATITGYGWHANILNLRVGRHLYTTEVDEDGATHAFHHVVNIIPRTHSDDD